jgi:TPR repeat protein
MFKFSLLFILFTSGALASEATSDGKLCLEYAKEKENYKIAHKNEHCLKAAKEGYAPAQYAVALGFNSDGKHVEEEKYYKLAAAQDGIAAYLGLGHLYRYKDEDKAIYWYSRYVQTKSSGYGYAAILIAKIYKENENTEMADKWLNVCLASPYGDKCNL